MAEKELTLTVVVDGKEGTKTLRMTDKELNKVRADAQAAGQTMQESMEEARKEAEKTEKQMEDTSDSVETTAEAGRKADESFERAGETIGKTRRRYESLTEAQQKAFGDLVEMSGQGTRSLSRMEAGMVELERRADLTAAQLREASVEARSMSRGMDAAGRRSGQASELLFGLGDAASDARYGIEAVGNNFALAAEQGANLVAQAGSARGALASVGSALLGPAGVVVAIQGLIALGPEIVDFFNGGAAAAEKMEKEMKDAAEGMFEISEEVGSFEEATLQQAEAVQSSIQKQVQSGESVVSDLQTLVGALEETESPSGISAFAGTSEAFQVEALKERLGLQDVSLEQAREMLEAERATLADQKAILSTVETQVSELRRRKRLAEEFRRQGVEPSSKETSEDQKAAIREAMMERRKLRIQLMEDGLEKRLAQIDFQIDQQIAKYRSRYREDYPRLFAELRRLLEKQRAKLKDDALNDPVPLVQPENRTLEAPEVDFDTDLFTTPEGIRAELENGLIDSINAADDALSDLKAAYDNATTDKARQEIQKLMDKIRRLRGEMKNTDKDVLSLGETLDQGLADAVSTFSEGIGEMIVGQEDLKGVAASVLKSLAQLAVKVGQLMIGFGTAALALSPEVLLSNPVTAIGAGAALVALGTAAKAAISSTIGSETSGGGGAPSGGGRGARDGIEGGGEGRASVPGFEEGVDDFRGGMARVHDGELLTYLPRGANVITNENVETMQAATRALASQGSASRMNKETVRERVTEKERIAQIDHNFSIGIGNGFKVVENLDRIRQDRADLVGGE